MHGKTLFHDDTALPPEAAITRPSSLRTADDQSGANRAADAFRTSLHRHLAHRWPNDRSASVDQIGTVDDALRPPRPVPEGVAGTIEAATNHAEIRRQDLSAVPGARHFAEVYGLQTAVDKRSPQMQLGLRITNPLGAKYHRFIPGPAFQDHCLSVYRALGHTHPSNKVAFANSRASASRVLERLERAHRSLMELCPKRGIKPSGVSLAHVETGEVKPLTRGLVAIELNSESDFPMADALVGILGGRPSMFEVVRLAGPQPSAQETSARRPAARGNTAALSDMFRSNREAVATLRALPDGHTLQATAHCAAALLEGLEGALSRKLDTPECKHDLVVAGAVDALTRVARALPTLTEDSTRFAAAYAALFEEMHLVLAAVKPYGEADFKKAAAGMLAARAGPTLANPQIAPPETFLLSSGMDAIASGAEIAKLLTGSRQVAYLSSQTERPEYFETEMLVSQDGSGKAARIWIGVLNPSTPTKASGDSLSGWNTDKVVEAVRHRLLECEATARNPAVLVLDTTIEQQRSGGTSDLAMVLGALAPDVEAGRLKIVLCKSYQKYTSLGIVKLAAGGVSLIGKDDAETRAATARLNEIEDDLGWMSNDESQLLTHLITYAHGSELEMIGKAAKNAAFVYRLFEGTQRFRYFFTRHEERLPFVATNFGSQTISVATRWPKMTFPWLLAHRQVPPRDGFGFLGTTLVPPRKPTNELRISAGQETQAELVEKLYAFAWLTKAAVDRLTLDEISRKSHFIAGRAMRFVLEHADVTTWAPAAVQILRERANGGEGTGAATIRQCEDLLADGTQKDVLQKALKAALQASAPRSDRLLSDQLRIIGSAYAPRLTDSARRAGDVDAMRTELKVGEATDSLPDRAARFAPNAVASLLAMAGMAFGPKEVEDRETLDSLYRSVFASGLPGVSPSTREHLLCDWACHQRRTIELAATPQAQRAAVEELVRNARLSPYRETRAKMFAALSDYAFAVLEPSVQRHLTDSMFGPLDAASRLALTKKLAKSGDTIMLSRCLERFGKDLDQADEGASVLLSPTMLSGKTERPEDPQQPIDAKSCNELRGRLLHAVLPDGNNLLGFGYRMAVWAPFLCTDSATASRLTDIAYECESTRVGRPPQALSEHIEMLPEPYRQVMRRYSDESTTRRADYLFGVDC